MDADCTNMCIKSGDHLPLVCAGDLKISCFIFFRHHPKGSTILMTHSTTTSSARTSMAVSRCRTRAGAAALAQVVDAEAEAVDVAAAEVVVEGTS